MVVASLVVPYVGGMLHPETVRAVVAAGPPAAWCSLPPGDPGAYGDLLRALWRLGRTFVLVEHDMAPDPDHLRRMRSCGHDWCGHRYWCGPTLVSSSFGVVRVSGQVMAAHPTLAAQATLIDRDPRRPVPWGSVAESFARVLQISGYRWVEHDGVVDHLHGRRPGG